MCLDFAKATCLLRPHQKVLNSSKTTPNTALKEFSEVGSQNVIVCYTCTCSSRAACNPRARCEIISWLLPRGIISYVGEPHYKP